MTPRVTWAWVPLAVALAALELSHPVWNEGSAAAAVAAAGEWWTLLHALLILGYAAVVMWLLRGLAPEAGAREPLLRLTRLLVLLFEVCNTTFLCIDGPLVGWLAHSDPDAAERLWHSAGVALLADGTGATWAGALLCLAWRRHPSARGRTTRAGLVVTWLAFVATATSLPGAGATSRVVALGTGAWSVYSGGAANLQFALLVCAAMMHQHAGPEAAVGILFVLVALGISKPLSRDVAVRG